MPVKFVTQVRSQGERIIRMNNSAVQGMCTNFFRYEIIVDLEGTGISFCARKDDFFATVRLIT